MSRLGPGGFRARIAQYIAALGDTVSVWEVGNEVNGNWVGADPMAKVAAMFDAAKSAGRRNALTLYYENPTTPGFAMIPWVDEHIPDGHRMRSGMDYVLVSDYDDQNAGHQPRAGGVDPALLWLPGPLGSELPRRGFYWHFRQTMAPRSKPDWSVLSEAFQSLPRPAWLIGGPGPRLAAA